jgi:hypothetical protein
MRILAGTGLVIAMLALLTWMAWSRPSVEFAEETSDIMFSHELHVEEGEMACITCHENAEKSISSIDWNLPSMDICSECHDEVEDDEECGVCHRNAEDPGEFLYPEREVEFNHQVHLGQGVQCTECHGVFDESNALKDVHLPAMSLCLDCHEGTKADDKCELCHGSRITLADIHPGDWLHLHRDRIITEPEGCQVCHRNESSCLECHRGDNLTGKIHSLNYQFTHGLDAKGKEKDCQRCHSLTGFCNDCHQRELLMPLQHSSLSWLTQHGRVATRDIENCASCHDERDPTCARSGCHSDFDGIRGTDRRLHIGGIKDLNFEGEWHEDNGSFCYQCHVDTKVLGQGFCGYCHR